MSAIGRFAPAMFRRRYLGPAFAWVLVCLLALTARGAETKLSADALRRLQLASTLPVVIIDVRAPKDFALGHVQGSIHIPFGELSSASLPRDSQLVLYCSELSCSNSTRAAQILAARGHDNVSVLEGGFSAWTEKGYPVQTSAPQIPVPSPRLSAAEAEGRLQARTLAAIDTRPALEFKAGHLPGALSLPLEELSKSIPSVPRDQPLLVYDRSAERSAQAGQLLAKEGFTVYELTGGVSAWARGRPLEVKGP